MSEYQYYEFQAVDRPLTEKEMGELRSFSTRARITPTGFVNDYSFGNFKGDENAWMEKYFDAFLYVANWGTRVLKLRLPAKLLAPEAAKLYCPGKSAFVQEKGDKIVLTFVSEDEDMGGQWVVGEGWLPSLIPVRAELARGDLRALSLGWLLCAQSGELDDKHAEPPVPAGLGQLSAPLESLAEFLRIDRDLLNTAAEASVSMEDTKQKRGEIQAWLADLPAKEKDDMLAGLITGEDPAIAMELLQRYLKDQADAAPKVPAPRRTVGELLRMARAHAEERRRIEAERRAAEKERQEREAAIARAKYLNWIAGSEEKLWTEVEGHIATKQLKSYDKAVKLIIDLRDLASRDGKSGEFNTKLGSLLAEHSRKSAFTSRLRKEVLE